MAINLSNDEAVNPITRSGYIFIAFGVFFLSLIIVLFTKFKLDHVMVLLIAGAIIVPLSIYALEKITINISTKVEIVSPEDYFAIAIPHCGYTGPTQIKDIKYLRGMTIEEFMNSEYYTTLRAATKEQISRVFNSDLLFKADIKRYDCINNVYDTYYHQGMTNDEWDEFNHQREICYSSYGGQDENITTQSKIESQSTAIYSYTNLC